MRAIDADKLGEVKFHSLPYTHITPSDVEAESYKRGWNDAIDSIIESVPTIELRCEECESFNKTRLLVPQPERKRGRWIEQDDAWDGVYYECSVCKEPFTLIDGTPSENLYNFCPNCGADMRGDNYDQSK